MSNEAEVYRTLAAATDKYTYFLLAGAAAAIAFAVNQTRDDALSLAHLPLGIAVGCWGVSFLSGCRSLSYVRSTLFANLNLLKVQAGKHPEVGNHPDFVAAAGEGIRSAILKNGAKSSFYDRVQFWMLVIGSCFFVGWHVIEMYLRMPASPAIA